MVSILAMVWGLGVLFCCGCGAFCCHTLEMIRRSSIRQERVLDLMFRHMVGLDDQPEPSPPIVNGNPYAYAAEVRR